MRVIAGDFRGRKLRSLKGEQTRPTASKVKESLFNMIGPYFAEESFLDLYSGSGAVAIEALSRGMKQVVCVDKNYHAIQVIQENLSLVRGTDRALIIKKEAQAALQTLAKQEQFFDYVFLDPPYSNQRILKEMALLLELDLLKEQSLVICETAKEVKLPQEIEGYRLLKRKTYGGTDLTIYEKDD